MAHTPDHIEINVTKRGGINYLVVEPPVPRIVRGEEFEVTGNIGGDVTKMRLKDFKRLLDRKPNGNGRRPDIPLEPDSVNLEDGVATPITLMRKDKKPDDDDNYRYVKYTLELILDDGTVLEIDPMWDEMP